MNIAQRIRSIADGKIKVSITKRTRNKGGFYVWFPIEDTLTQKFGMGCEVTKTKREAAQKLLAKVRCFEELEFRITLRPPHVGDT